MILNDFTPFIQCISELSNSQADNAKNWVIAMPMYNLLEYSKNYPKKSGNL